jgi:hypothetical protein
LNRSTIAAVTCHAPRPFWSVRSLGSMSESTLTNGPNYRGKWRESVPSRVGSWRLPPESGPSQNHPLQPTGNPPAMSGSGLPTMGGQLAEIGAYRTSSIRMIHVASRHARTRLHAPDAVVVRSRPQPNPNPRFSVRLTRRFSVPACTPHGAAHRFGQGKRAAAHSHAQPPSRGEHGAHGEHWTLTEAAGGAHARTRPGASHARPRDSHGTSPDQPSAHVMAPPPRSRCRSAENHPR